MKRFFAFVLVLSLLLSILSEPLSVSSEAFGTSSSAAAGVSSALSNGGQQDLSGDLTTFHVTSNISGVDIYVDGVFTDKVTPADVDVQSAAAVTLSLRGYATTAAAVENNSINFTLAAELVPSGCSSHTLTVTTEDDSVDANDSVLSLREAVQLAMADTSEDWIVIDFADDVIHPAIYASIVINERGKITINGGGDVVVPSYGWEGAIKPLTANLRIVDLIFDGNSQNTCLSLRPVGDEVAALHIDELYILGCTFLDTCQVGVTTCVPYGRGGTDYGSDYTVNYKDLTFAGNSFQKTRLFSFAAAGDGDYNVIDGYYVLANQFVDGGIGMLAADAHTGYVYGDTNMAYCEYNILKNVLVSGNTITMTENTPAVYEALLGIGTANLGNSNNLVEYVEVRNNTTRITGGDKNMYSAVSITNAAVADVGNDKYSVAERTHSTSNNTMRYVSVHNNDLALGNGREFAVCNVSAGEGCQYGSDNTMEHIDILNNSIYAAHGVVIANFVKTAKSCDCLNNTLSSVRFEGNTLYADTELYWDVGLLVAGTQISNHGQQAVAYPNYAGTFSDVTISNNDISGYGYGILCAGSAGDYGVGANVSDISIDHNRITTANYNSYAEVDVGILVAGSALQTHSDPADPEGSPLQPSNKDCSVTNVTLRDNSITARLGILVCGNEIENLGDGVSTGNSVNGVTLSGNSVTLRTLKTGEQGLNLPAVLFAGAVDYWGRLASAVSNETVAYSVPAYLKGNVVTDVSLADTTIVGFAVGVLRCETIDTAQLNAWEHLGDGTYRLKDSGTNLSDVYTYLSVPLYTATPTPVVTATPTPTATATPKPTATATPTPTATATPKPTATATPTPTVTATPKPTTSATPTASATPKPTATATPKPTATATPKPTATAAATPTATATPKPTATAAPTPTATATAAAILWGDANGDKAVTAADAATILRWGVKLASAADIDLDVSDVNHDGKVSSDDAAKILRWTVKLESSLDPR